MNQDKHMKKGGRTGTRMNRTAILLIAMILLISTAVGTTVAFLMTNTEPVESGFEYARVSCEATESLGKNASRYVQVKNTGTVNAYIRATYVVNWLDSEKNIVASVPEGYSYTLTENPSCNWINGEDGYFYYLNPVAPGYSTSGSLLTCTATYPDHPEYTLSVEILAEAIQSTPKKAIAEAWGVTVSGGKPAAE